MDPELRQSRVRVRDVDCSQRKTCFESVINGNERDNFYESLECQNWLISGLISGRRCNRTVSFCSKTADQAYFNVFAAANDI